MEFYDKDLLSIYEIEDLITSNFTTERARIITEKLSKYLFISNKTLYIINQNITYTIEDKDIDTQVLYYTSLLLEKSVIRLQQSKRYKELLTQLQKTYGEGGAYNSIFRNSHIKTYFPQLLMTLTNNNVVFNLSKREIHYNNGYMDLNTNIFKSRVLHKHYMTEYIKRDYAPSTENQQKAILKLLSKTYPDFKDFECILFNLGASITGESTKDQETLFLLGTGASGKSTIMLLCAKIFECYFQELKSNSFAKGAATADKTFNTFFNRPHIRIIWVNELEDVKIDESAFKKFCEGLLATCKLYKDGTFNFEHFAKLWLTANSMPNIKIDTGVTRRLRGYTHKSNFVDDIKMVDEKNNVYLKDLKFLDNCIEMNLLNAFFDIICKYSKKYLDGEKPIYTQNFIDTKSIVVDSNDSMQDFIDGNIKITNDPKDKIGKNSMLGLYKAFYPTKHLTPLQLITSLKEKKLNYDSGIRADGGIRGAFTGVTLKDDDFEDEDENDNKTEEKHTNLIEESNIKELNKKYYDVIKCNQELEKRNEELEKRLQELENQLKIKTDEEKEPKELIKIEETQIEELVKIDKFDEEPIQLIEKNIIKKIKIKKEKEPKELIKIEETQIEELVKIDKFDEEPIQLIEKIVIKKIKIKKEKVKKEKVKIEESQPDKLDEIELGDFCESLLIY
jgi:hypothetical protein